MIKGLYTSALGMMTQMQKMDVVTNNIANVNTTGFKRDQAVSRSFTEELTKRLNDSTDMIYANRVGPMSLGVFLDDVYTDFSSGSLRQTRSPLDVSITGDGFFAISTQDANGEEVEKYSRDGAFTLLQDGTLVTKTGERVLGEGGAIVIPNGIIKIDERGQIFSNGTLVDTLKMVSFEDTHTLRKNGDNLYATTPESVQTEFTGVLSQGFLENSNANAVREMVDMITTARIYDANQRMITTHDTILSKVVNEVGRK